MILDIFFQIRLYQIPNNTIIENDRVISKQRQEIGFMFKFKKTYRGRYDIPVMQNVILQKVKPNVLHSRMKYFSFALKILLKA